MEPSNQPGQGGGPLRVTVYKYPPPNGSTDGGAGSDGAGDWVAPWSPARDALYPNDWIIPWSPERDALYPNDWILPATEPAGVPASNDWKVPTPSAIASNPPPTANAPSQIGVGRIGAAAPFTNSYPASPPPISRDALVPSAAQKGAAAWDAPILPGDWPAIMARYFPETAPQSTFGNSMAVPPPPAARNPLLPSTTQTGAAAWDPPIFLGDWPAIMARYFPAPMVSSALPDSPNSPGLYPLAGHALSPIPGHYTTHGPVPPMPPLESSNNVPPPLSSTQAANSTLDYHDQRLQRSLLHEPFNSTGLEPGTASSSTELNWRPRISSANPTQMDAPHSATHVVFSPTGRVVAIIHVYPGSSDDLRHLVRNDVTPDSPRPGAQYAQINNATTSNPFIDRTTDMLLWTLMQSVQAMGDGFGANFGTAVHTDFAKRVRQLDLPGIGQDGVEQTFHPKILLRHPRLLRYGLSGSIRTDVILRDPKDPRQRPIAVYDLKTGNAYLTPRRIQKIKDYVKEPEIIVIELRYGTVESLVR